MKFFIRLQLFSFLKKTQNTMDDRPRPFKIFKTLNREDSTRDCIILTCTTYNQHFNLYYISQLVIKFKAPVYGDFTFTLQPIELNTVTCSIELNHATVTESG